MSRDKIIAKAETGKVVLDTNQNYLGEMLLSIEKHDGGKERVFMNPTDLLKFAREIERAVLASVVCRGRE